MTSPRICGVCGHALELGAPERWIGPEGEAIDVRQPKQASALIELPDGDVEICAACYPERVEQAFSEHQLM